MTPLFGEPEKQTSQMVPLFGGDLGSDIKPNSAARVLRLQYKTGLPTAVIERNLDQVEKQALREDFDAEEFRKTSPLLAAWMAENPNNAAIGIDDVEGMSALESALSIPRSIAQGVDEGLKKDRASRQLGWKEVIGTITPQEKAERDRLNQELNRDQPRFSSGLPSWFKGAADVLGMNAPAFARAASGGAVAAAPVTLAASLSGGPILGASVGTSAFGVASTTLYLSESYKGAVGEVYDELVTVKDQSGASLEPTVAKYAALVAGLPVAGLDLLSFGTAMKVVPGAGKLMGKIAGMKNILLRPSAKSALADFAKKYAIAGGTEITTEGLQEFLSIMAREAGQEISGQEFAPDSVSADAERIAGVMQQAGKAFAVLGLVPAPIKIMETRRDIHVAQQNEAFFKALGDASSESKAMKNAPEAVRNFLENAKGKVDNIYVPVERFDALFQEDAPQVAAEIFGSQEQYLEARTLNADLVIPTETYALKVAGTKFHQQLIPDLRLGAGQMTLREAELAQKNTGKLLAEHERKFAQDEPYRRVYDDILGQAMGTMDRTAAERVALIEAEHYRTLGERLGEDAFTVYESLQGGLTIRRELPQVLRSMKDVDLELDPLLDELRAGKSAREQDIYGRSLSDFLRHRGGIQDEGGELSALGVDEERRPFVKKLIQESGLSLDTAAEIAAEAGYIPERDINALLDAIDGESRGRPVYSQEQINQELQTRAQNIKDLGDYLDQAGIDLKTLDNAAVRKRLREARPSDDVLEQGKKRGAYDRATRTITLFKGANPSTIIHELGHDWLEELRTLAGREDIPERIKNDWKVAREYLGVGEEVVSREAHEKWARSFEAYFMEGKAPSMALREVFSRLKDWMVRLYKTVRGLDVELTDEIRGVFDRLLATDDAIQDAREAQAFMPIGKEGMTEAEATAYEALTQAAKTEADDIVRVRVLSELSREREAWWRNERASVRETVAAEVNAQPVYLALAWLRTGKLPDGRALEGMEHARLSKTDLVRRYGQAFLTRLPFVYQVEGGLHPDMAADLFGFETGEEMIKAMVEARPKNALIDAETDERMRAEHGDMMMDGTLADVAAQATRNDRQIDVFMEEMRILRRRGAQGELTPTKVLKDLARSIIGGKLIEELHPFYYERATGKAGREAEDALIRRDWTAAFEAKQRQTLSMLMAHEARRQKDQVDADLKAWKAMFKPDEQMAKRRNMDMVNAARAIAGAHGIGRSPGKPQTYMEQLRLYDPDTYNDLSEIVAMATAQEKPYKKLSLADYGIVRDAINGLWEISRATKQIEIEGKKVELDGVIDEGSTQLAEFRKPGVRAGYESAVSPADKRNVFFLSRRAHARRMEHWAWAMDKGAKGLFTKLSRKISGAVVDYRLRKADVIKDAIDILARIDSSFTMDKIFSHELNYTFGNSGSGFAELLGAIQHRGNPSNFQKLLRGRKWGDFKEDGSLDTSKWDAFITRMHREGVLRKEHYDAMQDIWNLVGGMLPKLQETHKKIYGYYFDEVTAAPFETPFGTYQGGYVPARVDPFVSDDAAMRMDKEALEAARTRFTFPTTGRGATKSRVEAYAGPLDMDMRRITQHLDWALRFIHIEPHVREVARLFNDRRFAAELAAVDTEVKSELVIPWLERAASQIVEEPSKTRGGRMMDNFFSELRRRSISQIMTANVINALQQPLGVLQSIPIVGARNMQRALFHYMRSPSQATEFILAKDKAMSTRINTATVELYQTLDAILLKPSPYEKAQEFSKNHGLFLQRGAQSLVDKIVWMAAYDKALATGLTDAEAVAEAFSMVKMTQGSGAPEDISAWETGPPIVRLAKMFTGFFNNTLNLTISEIGISQRLSGTLINKRALYFVGVALFLNAALNEALYRAMLGKGFDDDDDDSYLDDWMRMFFLGTARLGSAMIPVLGAGPVLNGFINRVLTKERYDDRISTSPVIPLGESALRAAYLPVQFLKDDDINSRQAVRDVLITLGMATALPLAPLAKPISYLMDVESGEAEPTGPLDFTRGLITGRTGE